MKILKMKWLHLEKLLKNKSRNNLRKRNPKIRVLRFQEKNQILNTIFRKMKRSKLSNLKATLKPLRKTLKKF